MQQSAHQPTSSHVATYHTSTNILGLVTPQEWLPPMAPDQATELAQAYNTMSLNDGSDASWYMDIGATYHLASNTGNLFSVQNKIHEKFIFFCNG